MHDTTKQHLTMVIDTLQRLADADDLSESERTVLRTARQGALKVKGGTCPPGLVYNQTTVDAFFGYSSETIREREARHAQIEADAAACAAFGIPRDLHDPGYGRQRMPEDVQATMDLLCLADVQATEDEVRSWTRAQVLAAEAWAGAVHVHASDNDDVEVPPRPEFLPDRRVETDGLWPVARAEPGGSCLRTLPIGDSERNPDFEQYIHGQYVDRPPLPGDPIAAAGGVRDTVEIARERGPDGLNRYSVTYLPQAPVSPRVDPADVRMTHVLLARDGIPPTAQAMVDDMRRRGHVPSDWTPAHMRQMMGELGLSEELPAEGGGS